MPLPTNYDSWLSSAPEAQVIATTWNNEPLYNGDEVYETPSGDYVMASELQEWVEHNIGKPFELWKEDL